jgi:hypothetical protein
LACPGGWSQSMHLVGHNFFLHRINRLVNVLERCRGMENLIDIT